MLTMGGAVRWVEVDLDAVAANLAEVRRRVGTAVRIAAVVKGNAYGHGLVPIADTLARAGVDYLAVSAFSDVEELRSAGQNARLLLLTPMEASDITSVPPGVALTVTSTKGAQALARISKQQGRCTSVHIKVDTGMTRFGVCAANARELLAEVEGLPALHLAGIWTHFADAADPGTVAEQLARLRRALPCETLRARGVLCHAAATGAVVSGQAESWLDMVRPGLCLYGIGVNGAHGFQPALSWHSRLVEVQEVPSGTPVGYGGTYRTSRPSRIGVVPVGFTHGYPRGLSGQTSGLIRGKQVPLVGRIAMEFMMVDCTDAPGAAVGDKVTLIGEQGGTRLTIDDVIRGQTIIANELTCNLPAGISRLFRGG